MNMATPEDAYLEATAPPRTAHARKRVYPEPSQRVIDSAYDHWNGGHWIWFDELMSTLDLGFAYVAGYSITDDPDELERFHAAGVTTCYFKVGRSRNPSARLWALQTGIPHVVTYDTIIHGGRYTEKLIQGIAAKDHEHAKLEWYAGSAEGFTSDNWIADVGMYPTAAVPPAPPFEQMSLMEVA